MSLNPGESDSVGWAKETGKLPLAPGREGGFILSQASPWEGAQEHGHLSAPSFCPQLEGAAPAPPSLQPGIQALLGLSQLVEWLSHDPS